MGARELLLQEGRNGQRILTAALAKQRLGPAPSAVTLAARALRLLCPHCGEAPLFRSLFGMHADCPSCNLHFEREQGFFLGAIYLNYGVTVVLGLGSVLLLDAIHPMPVETELAIALPLLLFTPLVVFRHARSMWLAITYFASPPEPSDFR